MKYPRATSLVAALVSLCWFSVLHAAGAVNPSLESGHQYLSVGNYSQAQEQSGQAATVAAQLGDAGSQLLAAIKLADQLSLEGNPEQSIAVLESIRPLAEAQGAPRLMAGVYGRLGAAYMRVGKLDHADDLLNTGVELSKSVGDDSLLASLLNDLGYLLVLNSKLTEAKSAFEASIAAAATADSPQVEISARNNLARTQIAQGDSGNVATLLEKNYQQTKALPDSSAKNQSLLSIGALMQQAGRLSGSGSALRTRTYTILRDGLALARKLHDERLESYALGYIGRLYEDEKRLSEALSYTDRALFIAQKITAYDSLYLWEWQLGRLLRDSGEHDNALLAYKQSINSLQKIRTGLMYSTYGGFRRKVGPVYLEYADLLIKQIPEAGGAAAAQDLLAEVRLTLEQSKVAEVEAYFQDECVVTRESVASLDRVAPGVAVIYPLLLPDRTEILVSFYDGIRRYTSDVEEKVLTATVRQFRSGLESASPEHEYRDHAEALYGWLLEPLASDLQEQNIDTLVFVPDGSLRSVPLSALYDGSGFLVERFAIATTPGLTITNPQPIALQGLEILVNGITEPVQGFSALPNVGKELDSIHEVFADNSTTLKDDQFVLHNVRSQMSEGNYSIVHLATHGQFDSDHRKSFLLAYDGKFTMQNMSETIRSRSYQENPIELLVLSACQTAAGDDRAALGLAGVAIQAGAHSALASLWFIDDEATADLVSAFYRQLSSGEVTKAEALRKAQLSLLKTDYNRHPAYWAPFLLIGNWL